ncbi:MAG: ATPase, partial [Pseudomonas sp.]
MNTLAADSLTAAIERCADEPIHIPGGIQPHGFLLVVAVADLTVLQVSENVNEWLGLAAQELLGLPLTELISDPELLARLAALSGDDPNPFHLGDVRFTRGTAGHDFALMGHRNEQQLILEFERASNPGEAYG